jgi:hypothetical protein
MKNNRMENLQNILSKNMDFGSLLIYDIYDGFLKTKQQTEFCFTPRDLYYNHFGYNLWLNLVNCILGPILGKPAQGAQGTYTDISLSMLNKRIVQPGDTIISPESIFNARCRYIHGTVTVGNKIDSEHGFVALDAKITFTDDLGSIRFTIGRK